MKGFLFEQNRTDAVFWINENGTVSQKYIKDWIGCIPIDPENDCQLLMQMILCSKFKAGQVTAEYLNSIG